VLTSNSGLDRLPYAVEAPFNSYAKQHSPYCLPNTRVDLLQEIYDWADGQDERCIFWLNGLAGTGKSTIARTVARNHFEKKRLGTSFFFSRGEGDVGHAGKFCTTVTVQLANNVPNLHRHIYDAVTNHGDITSLSLHEQWRQLVLKPLSKLTSASCLSSYVLVIDALDECDDDNNIRTLLHLLAEARSLTTVRLRIFMTSRPEIPIRHGFYQIPDTEHQDFILHSISPSVVDRDISNFLEYNLGLIRQERCLGTGWPGEQVIKRLVQKASGLFIWAATACRFVSEGRQFTERRLSLILKSDTSLTAPERHLNKIYITILNNSVSHGYDDYEREELLERLRKVLGNIVVLFSPLSAGSLSRLIHLMEEVVDQTLEDLHAILDILEDRTRPLRLHHPSFRDFLLDKGRCSDPNPQKRGNSSFWVDERETHEKLTNKCLQLMSSPKSLKRNMCNLTRPGTLRSEIDSRIIDNSLPPEIQYAYRYWVHHLKQSKGCICDGDLVHTFLQKYFLY
jgi:NACHT domain